MKDFIPTEEESILIVRARQVTIGALYAFLIAEDVSNHGEPKENNERDDAVLLRIAETVFREVTSDVQSARQYSDEEFFELLSDITGFRAVESELTEEE